jgi:hypothetical protein
MASGTTTAALIARVDALIAVLQEQHATAARSPWMTPREVCVYLRWIHDDGAPDVAAFYRARKRYGLPASRIAGALRCRKDRIESWAMGMPAAEVVELRERLTAGGRR